MEQGEAEERGHGRAGVTRRRRGVRILRAGGVVALAAVVGAVAWHTAQDHRLRRAFRQALEERVEEVVPSTAGGLAEDVSSLRIAMVSYNVWALPVPLPGMDRLGRLPRVPGALALLDADLILLQEAFDVRMKALLAEYFDTYRAGPDLLCREPMVPLGEKDCTGGLVTLSRWPVLDERFYVHPQGDDPKLDEKNGRKGFMLTTLETPLGAVDVVNIHLYAGRTPADEEHRLLQLAQLRDVVGHPSGSSRPVVLAGDLNVVHPFLSARDPAVAPSAAYRFLVDSLGFVDTRADADESDFSYDVATNRYADVWYNRFEGRQVFDYVMVRLPEGMTFEVVERRRVLDGSAPLSDHYGVFVDVELRRVP